MGLGMPRFRTALGLAVIVGLVGAAPAAATARFASPTGTGSACTSMTPCPIETAVNSAVSGDDVTLTGGPYSTSTMLEAHPGVTVHGTTGAAPVVSSSDVFAFEIEAGSALRDVHVEHSGGGAAVLAFGAGSVVERVFAHSSAASIACEAGPGSLFRDVSCWQTGVFIADDAAIKPYSSSGAQSVTLRNVTAVSTVEPGMIDQSNSGTTTNVTATSVIARGTPVDVGTQDISGGTSSVVFDHSNYASESDPSNEITDPGTGTGNVTVAPAFVNAATGDFHETALSTGTIDLGSSTGLLPGELDLDGQARSQGAAPDIGAYEIAPTAQSPPGPTPTPTATPPAAATGQRAAALRKCKRKHGTARKKCKKKANLLPV